MLGTRSGAGIGMGMGIGIGVGIRLGIEGLLMFTYMLV